jgi:hypothetical protein
MLPPERTGSLIVYPAHSQGCKRRGYCVLSVATALDHWWSKWNMSNKSPRAGLLSGT